MHPRISIFSILITYFGRSSRNLANDYIDETLRNINIRETLTFNKRCRKNNLLHRTLLQRPPLQSPLGHKIARQNAFRYLDGYIQDGYRRLRNSNQRLLQLQTKVVNDIPDYLNREIVNYLEKKHRKNFKNRLIQKYDKM